MACCLNLPVADTVMFSRAVQFDHDGALLHPPWILLVDTVARLIQRGWLSREFPTYPAGQKTVFVAEYRRVEYRCEQKERPGVHHNNKVNQSAPSRGCGTEVPWHLTER